MLLVTDFSFLLAIEALGSDSRQASYRTDTWQCTENCPNRLLLMVIFVLHPSSSLVLSVPIERNPKAVSYTKVYTYALVFR